MYFDTIGLMKGYTSPVAGEEIIVAGYHSVADGGGGTFIWVAGTLSAYDEGIHFESTGATGYYQRLYSGDVQARWFGTYGNGTNDDAPALNKAISYCIDKGLNLHLDGNFTVYTSLEASRFVNSSVAGYEEYFVISGGGIHAAAAIPVFTSAGHPNPNHNPLYPISQLIRFREVIFSGDTANESYVLDGNKFLRTTFDGCTFTGIKLLTTTSFIQSIYLINCQARHWTGVFLNTTGGCYDTRITHGLYEAGESFANLTGTLSGHGSNASITNNVIEGLSGYGIRYKFSSALSICFNYFEHNLEGDIVGTDNQDIEHPNRGISHIGNYHYFNFPVDGEGQPIFDFDYYPVSWGATLGGVSVSNSSNANMNYFTTSVCEVFNGNATSWNRDNVSTHFGIDKMYYGTNPGVNGGIVNYSGKIDPGTVVFNTDITDANPNTGWVCTKAGTYATAGWKAFGTVNALMDNRGPALNGNEDLNTFTTDGYYFPVLPASWSLTGTHFPTTQRGLLTVQREGSSTLDLVQQYRTIVNGPSDKAGIYSRTYYGYGGYWSAWREVVTAVPGTVTLPAAIVPNTAGTAAGATPTKAEFDTLLAEVRSLKTSLSAAGLLA